MTISPIIRGRLASSALVPSELGDNAVPFYMMTRRQHRLELVELVLHHRNHVLRGDRGRTRFDRERLDQVLALDASPLRDKRSHRYFTQLYDRSFRPDKRHRFQSGRIGALDFGSTNDDRREIIAVAIDAYGLPREIGRERTRDVGRGHARRTRGRLVDLDPVLHGRFFPIGEDVDRPFDLAQDARELVARFKQDIGVRAANLHLDHVGIARPEEHPRDPHPSVGKGHGHVLPQLLDTGIAHLRVLRVDDEETPIGGWVRWCERQHEARSPKP